MLCDIVTRQVAHWKKISANHTFDQKKPYNVEQIKNSQNSTVRIQTTQFKNGQKNWRGPSTKRTHGWKISNMKICSISLTIREKQIKAIWETITHHWNGFPQILAIPCVGKDSQELNPWCITLKCKMLWYFGKQFVIPHKVEHIFTI